MIKKIREVLFELIFILGTGIVTQILIKYNTPLKYNVVFFLIIIALFLLTKYLVDYINKPFVKRCINEDDAKKDISIIINSVSEKLRILSKVGTNIFQQFDEYSNIIEKGLCIQLLLVNPENEALINLLNKVFVKQKVNDHWMKMISKLKIRSQELLSNGRIRNKTYDSINEALDNAKLDGYKSLINASIILWQEAEFYANLKIERTKSRKRVFGLEIRMYNVLPDLKLWIADSKKIAVGTYDAINLGRENPIDIYIPQNKQKVQFDNFVNIWDYKYEQSDILTFKKFAVDLVAE